MPTNEIDTLALAPLSTGDLLDRIVRLYRQHWIPLMRIAILPVIFSFLGAMAISLGARNFATDKGDARIAFSVLLILGGFGFYLLGKAVFLLLLGGTARELVQHFMDGSPLKVREIYQQTKMNFWRLTGSAFFAGVMAILLLIVLYFILILGGGIYILSVVWLLTNLPVWVQVTCHIIFGVTAICVLAILASMSIKRALFIPQIITVESKNVSSAMSRSFALSGSEFKKKDFLPPIALLFFYIYISWSVLLLLLIPLFLYAELNGVEVGMFSAQQPLWYTIISNTFSQATEIMLMPVVMLGFILLYIDSRVRREGYDLELLANRYLPAPGIVIPHGSFPLEIEKPKSHDPENPDDSFDADSNLTLLSLR